MTDFFETRVENIKPREDKTILFSFQKKERQEIPQKKKKNDSDSSVIESSEESSFECRPFKMYCILHGK